MTNAEASTAKGARDREGEWLAAVGTDKRRLIRHQIFGGYRQI